MFKVTRQALTSNPPIEERQIYTVNLKVNTVIAIEHEMIFVYTVSTKLSSTSWDLMSVDHQAHCY